jgi:hypothetical protein
MLLSILIATKEGNTIATTGQEGLPTSRVVANQFYDIGLGIAAKTLHIDNKPWSGWPDFDAVGPPPFALLMICVPLVNLVLADIKTNIQ